jgi:AraC-like DNA-binding protein
MSLRFSSINGDALPFIQGLPRHYSGTIVKGASASHIVSSFGSIVVQEYSTGQMSMCHVSITWIQPERLICHYHYPPVLFSRVLLNNSLYEVIKGAGRFFIESEQFNVLTGSEWTGLMISERPGTHEFVNLAWSADLLNNAWSDFSIFNNKVQHFYRGLPDRVTGRIADITYQMKRTLEELAQVDLQKANDHSFNELMLKYLQALLRELRDPQSVKDAMSEVTRHLMMQAKQLIDENPFKRLSTPEISRKIGTNEFKLKKFFKILTGFNVDEYRKQQLFTILAKKMIQHPAEAIKNISAEAGYPSVTNLIRAFRNVLCCTPKEIRQATWDLSKLNDLLLPENVLYEAE